jgi:DNA-binding protein H-NS
LEGSYMAKIDLDSLGIEELVALRERVIEKLAEKVAARQAELEAEMEKLSQYGNSAKKSRAAPAAARQTKGGEVKDADVRHCGEGRGNGEAPIAQAA